MFEIGPMFVAFLSLKFSVSLHKEEDFQLKRHPPPKKKVVLKTGPIMLRNILKVTWTGFEHNLGPDFNTYLFALFLLKPPFYRFSANMQMLTTHQKTLFVSTPVLIALVKMSFFVLFFHVWGFSEFPILGEMFLIGGQESRNTKFQSKQSKKQQENKMQITRKSNLMIQNRTRQQAETDK